MARISIEGLTKRYGSSVAVNGIDLEIRDNEFLVLLGPSGCGKTTTLNMIAGLEEVTGGSIRFDERLMNDVPAHRREIAMVFQSYALYPQKTVRQNIAFGLKLRRMPADEIDRRVSTAARELEIDHLLDRKPAELSGGQRQRVALGRAIVRAPSVFLMDEPLSNLDAALRVNTRSLIKKLHHTMRTTFVYVTHDHAEAMTLADRIVVMNHGDIQQVGTPHEVYRRPANLFVARFLGSPQMNLVPGELRDPESGIVHLQGGWSLPVGRLPGQIPGSPPRPVVLGIRPEDVVAREPDAEGMPCTVAIVSPLGSEQFVETSLAGADLTFRVDKDVRVQPGDTMRLAFPPDRLHLFDAASGERLSTDPPPSPARQNS